MRYLLLLLMTQVAFAQSYSPGLPLPGLPKSLGTKPMSGSTSVTLAGDQTAITVTAGSGSITTTAAGKIPFLLVRNAYASTNVTTGAYVQLVAATSLPATSLDIFDSSGQTLNIAFGAPGSEVAKFYVYPGGNGVIPVAIPQGTRVSISATSGNATSGELDLNFYD